MSNDKSSMTVYVSPKDSSEEGTFAGSWQGYVSVHANLKGTDLFVGVRRIKEAPNTVLVHFNGPNIALSISLNSEASGDGDDGLAAARGLRDALNRAVQELEERAARPA
jgi:hypothetical protein